MSIVLDIKNALELRINSILPSFKRSKFVFDIISNPSNMINVYAIRPLDAQTVSGSNKTATIDQEFEIELATRYNTANESDTDLEIKVYNLYQEHEKLYKNLFRENFLLDRVLVVQSFRLTRPDISSENNFVSIIATYSIKYRTEVI